MITLGPTHLGQIRRAARLAYPNECCGLLVGRREGDQLEVDQVVESANLSAQPRNSFEIDMALRLTLQKDLRGTGRDLVGHYHSHPDGSPETSPPDKEQAWESNLVWMILSISETTVARPRAFAFQEGTKSFQEVPLALNGTGHDFSLD
ncbi:MAG: M67 family metallopeptidase [Proteobacteria bacterium]|nr:M67 family metallopeptidase [Pseudomonadota bacterium]